MRRSGCRRIPRGAWHSRRGHQPVRRLIADRAGIPQQRVAGAAALPGHPGLIARGIGIVAGLGPIRFPLNGWVTVTPGTTEHPCRVGHFRAVRHYQRLCPAAHRQRHLGRVPGGHRAKS
jgi:hypothetical protein